MNNTEIFTGKADNYAKFRPHYAQTAIDYLFLHGLLDKTSVVADIGSGTGIFASQILSSVSHVFCIEPNSDMRRKAKTLLCKFDNYSIVDATAENTLLPNNSIDSIIVAQAFHWLDPIAFKNECIRISKTSGPVILLWNRKIPCAMEDERRNIVAKYDEVEDYYNYSWEEREKGITNFFCGSVQYAEFDHPLIENFDSFIGRTLSSSHSISENSPQFSEYMADWTLYFNKFAKDGLIQTDNKTVIYWSNLNIK